MTDCQGCADLRAEMKAWKDAVVAANRIAQEHELAARRAEADRDEWKEAARLRTIDADEQRQERIAAEDSRDVWQKRGREAEARLAVAERVVSGLINLRAAVWAYSAKHAVDRCVCADCNTTRAAVADADAALAEWRRR